MAPVIPNPKRIRSFRSEKAFESWLRTNHAREDCHGGDEEHGCTGGAEARRRTEC
jgi:hypothetical protein